MAERHRKFMLELIGLLFKYSDIVKEWEEDFTKALRFDLRQYPSATTADVVVYYGGDC